MSKRRNLPSLIDFWRLRRRYLGLPCEVMPFHEEIASGITRLVMGTLPTPNLMVLIPPRCAKTDLCVNTGVPWAHSYFRDSETIIASYGLDLAVQSTMSIRDTMTTEWYRGCIDSTWGAHVAMVGDKAGGHVDHFRTLEGGSVKGIGVGGGITGFGAGKLREAFGGLLVMDDLLKAQEAKSPKIRKNAIDFIESGLNTRLNRKEPPATPKLLVMQRLHPDDPAGYFLANDRENWTVIQIPAHNPECTETIWPGRLGMDFLMTLKETRPDEYWSQYMQEPSQASTTIFKREWWRFWRDLSEVERRLTGKIITADTAFKAKDVNDYSVLQCWGFETSAGSYLIDQARGRWEFPELLAEAKAFLKKHTEYCPGRTPASVFFIEDKASGQSLVQSMRREGLPVRAWEPDDKTSPDKVGRANQCVMPIFSGRVYLPDPKLPGYKWVESFVNEHSSFTADDSHLYDDQVDAQTMAHLIWMQRGGGRGPVPVWDDKDA